MDKNTEIGVLLQEIAVLQRRNVRIGRIATVTVILLAAALLICLAVLVPKFTDTLEQAHSTLGDMQQMVQRINTSLDALDAVGENLMGITGEGTENLQKLIDTLSAVDVDALTRSIERFNSVLGGLSNFKLFG